MYCSVVAKSLVAGVAFQLVVLPSLAGAPKNLSDVLTASRWTWQRTVPNVTQVEEITFSSNGRANRAAHNDNWKWTVTGPNTIHLSQGETAYVDITFDATFSRYEGKGDGGRTIIGSRTDAINPALAPTSTPAVAVARAEPLASSASQGKLDELREHATALTESVLGPLDQETGASFRGYVSDLREDILDEAARKPAASANAYNLAVQLCNTIIAVEREREVMIARLDNNKPSNAAGSAGVTKVHPNWRDLERERDEAARATHNNTLETSFHRQITVQWGLRAAQLRKTFDAQIAQFRTGVRQSLPPR